ncbi:Phosphatidylcholine-sterol acyltransferase (Lecithin-cholesterol acyltransferase)/ Phospholipase A [Fasciola gigantica]|uniref:Phosphatidylcholine-sterol acyltransferase (Lecithin-cholesterol acyltransferase)/ Phospholipase A n=1 Tax=Fasciola gigantica TaxID=46835 RepID=A0A504YE90_FASGI|nr:Phosphatidylcholine-sterol acyltransferase (Lecithin-cholesterol acyltransferase)/ Phospholipase A [Fasciola gigantica]
MNTIICLSFILCLCAIQGIQHAKLPAEQLPMIFLPGVGGSQAYCYLREGNRTQSALIWVNLWYLMFQLTVAKQLELRFDPATGTTSDIGPCKIVFPGWGQTWTIENMDTCKHTATVYFEYLVSAVRKDPFYVSGRTLRGAPYDFRKDPYENETFVSKMKNLVEETYRNAGGRRIVLLGHSLGALYGLHFLRGVSDEWKKKYINTFLSVSGPLGGSVKAMLSESFGNNFGIPLRSPLDFRPIARSMTTTAFLLPDERIWPASVPLMITPTRNYSSNDYEHFFRDMNYTIGYQMYLDIKNRFDGFKAPTGVDEIYCVHGTQVDTPHQIIYLPPTDSRPPFPDQTPHLLMGDGDGTVDLKSLQICHKWPGVKTVTFPGASHRRILGDSRMIHLIYQVAGVKPMK